MITGIGIDIIELSRVQQSIERTPRLLNKVLTPQELELYQTLGTQRSLEFVGGRFAAKEAIAKALGTGIGGQFNFQDVSIIPTAEGRPVAHWHSPLIEGRTLHLSISHSKEYAVAQAIIEENPTGMSS